MYLLEVREKSTNTLSERRESTTNSKPVTVVRSEPALYITPLRHPRFPYYE
jgi:hypothetical protein